MHTHVSDELQDLVVTWVLIFAYEIANIPLVYKHPYG